jgi:hypothetical protein
MGFVMLVPQGVAPSAQAQSVIDELAIPGARGKRAE